MNKVRPTRDILNGVGTKTAKPKVVFTRRLWCAWSVRAGLEGWMAV